jgi:hypothetical protein
MADSTYVLQLALGATYTAAVASKLRSPRALLAGLEVRGLSSSWLRYAVIIVIVPFELWLALAHLFGWSLQTAAAAGAILIAGFGVITGVELWNGRRVPCLCFDSSGSEIISRDTLLRQALIVVAQLLLLSRLGEPRSDTTTMFDLQLPFEAAVATWLTALAGAFTVIIIVRWALSYRLLTDLGRVLRHRCAVCQTIN